MPLGIDGFTYADLYRPSRLRDLHDLFCSRVAADDPALWSEWDAYRTAPQTVTSPIERSDLIVRMAPAPKAAIEAPSWWLAPIQP